MGLYRKRAITTTYHSNKITIRKRDETANETPKKALSSTGGPRILSLGTHLVVWSTRLLKMEEDRLGGRSHYFS